MVDQIIRPWDLPNRSTPNASEKIPVDNGSTVGGATVESIVLSGRPTASQAEAEAGVDAVKVMTPLTTKQAVTSRIGVDIASIAQGNKADTAVQSVQGTPGNISVNNADPLNPVVSYVGSGVSDGDKGDIIVSDGGELWEVQNNTRIYYFDFVPRELRQGIADGTDTTTDQAIYWQAFRDALQNVANNGQRPYGLIPHCVIRTSVSPNFAIPGLKLETEGLPQIISLTTASAFRMDATGLGPAGYGLFGLEVGPLMAGGTSCTYAIEITYIHQSSFSPLYVMGATATGIQISFCVSTVFDKPICSTPYLPGNVFLSTPVNGIVMTAVEGDPKGTACGWCTLIGPIAEYVPNGIILVRAQGTIIIGGTAESCSQTGLTLAAQATWTTVLGTDFEANGFADVYCLAPYCTFTGIKAEHNFYLWGSANRCTMTGGTYGNIICDVNTSRNTFRDVLFATSSGESISDTGSENRFINCVNHQTGKFHSEWKPRSGIPTVPSSGGGATFTTTGSFFLDARTVHFTVVVNVVTAGSGAGYVNVTLPYISGASSYSFSGIEIGHSGKALSAYLGNGSANLQIREFDGSYPAGENGDLIIVSGSYERA